MKNWAVLFFYPYCLSTSYRVSEKSLERFPRSIRYEHTYIHPDKGDIIDYVEEEYTMMLGIFSIFTDYYLPKVQHFIINYLIIKSH